VAWTVDGDDALSLVWTETVPDFKAPQGDTPGFGSKLVTMAVQQLHGTIEQQYTNDGILIRLQFKLF
jgi:two-component sensor histidine kinase